MNLGDHVQDDPIAVAKNRQILNAYLPSEPVWLKQVHGVSVINAAESACLESADAAYAKQANVVCVVMTADCLPILLCNTQGTMVAAIHAGWRSLCDGVIESTIKAMQVDPSTMMAWLGPAIGPDAFEVGDEVRAQFMLRDPAAELAFVPHQQKWLGNLYTIAQQRLTALGVMQIYGQPLCTYQLSNRFFSFRRDGETGRMASLIWITD
jgi:YfiH family protein